MALLDAAQAAPASQRAAELFHHGSRMMPATLSGRRLCIGDRRHCEEVCNAAVIHSFTFRVGCSASRSGSRYGAVAGAQYGKGTIQYSLDGAIGFLTISCSSLRDAMKRNSSRLAASTCSSVIGLRVPA